MTDEQSTGWTGGQRAFGAFAPGLVHYTDMPRQPWVSHDNPNGELWYAAFRQALAEGFIRMEEVEDAMRRGHVSPRLLQWIGLAGAEVDEATAEAWSPPYRRFTEAA